jgi:hypothetical protein
VYSLSMMTQAVSSAGPRKGKGWGPHGLGEAHTSALISEEATSGQRS